MLIYRAYFHKSVAYTLRKLRDGGFLWVFEDERFPVSREINVGGKFFLKMYDVRVDVE